MITAIEARHRLAELGTIPGGDVMPVERRPARLGNERRTILPADGVRAFLRARPVCQICMKRPSRRPVDYSGLTAMCRRCEALLDG